jgi:chemotaxis protein MotA
MLVIVGLVVVIIGVLGGFTMAGGQIPLLIQPSEFLTIGAAAIGSILVSAPVSTVKKMIAEIIGTFSPKHYSKKDYMELLKSFNDLFLLAQRDGLLAIEKHIENPEESDVLGANQKFIKNAHAKTFFCDIMKVMLSGGIPPHELETLIDSEIEIFELENKSIPSILQKTADALPGLGIVAAVLGIIVTMGSINAGAEAVGHHVASALVGTFLGVLLSYGVFNPLATNIEHVIEGRVRFLHTIKSCIVAYAKGNPPIVAVEIARRTIFSDDRPTFQELENFIRGKG